ncbi:MAG: tyrosine-type recombinase/integrase [Burkholderiaceae bacterium]
MPEIQHAAALNRGQLKRLLTITRATSRYWQRDLLVLLLGHDAGLRITEIGRITIADIMRRDGTLRVEISLREAVTKGCKQRCAYLASKRLIAAIETYLAWRLAQGIGTELTAASGYRGLIGDLPLIWSSRGTGMSQNTKRRTLQSGERRDYKACDSLQAHISKLYKAAGLPDAATHSGRRSFAGNVLAATGDLGVVSALLGHEPDDWDVTARYIDPDPKIQCAIFAFVV